MMTQDTNSFLIDLMKAQAEMGRVVKNANNPYFKSKYADLNACLDVVLPALHAHGLLLLQPCGRDEFGEYVETIIVAQNGTTVAKSRVDVAYKAGDMQSKGGAITYARRYSLTSLFGLQVDDDDGESAVGRGKAQQPKKEAPKIENPNPLNTYDDYQLEATRKVAAAMKAFLNKQPSAEEMIAKGPKANQTIRLLAELGEKALSEELDKLWLREEQRILAP